MGVHLNKKGNVPFETSIYVGQSTAPKTFGAAWILTSVSHTWAMATQNKACLISSHSGRLHAEVCGNRQHASFVKYIVTGL
jgi:hypothetical protein